MTSIGSASVDGDSRLDEDLSMNDLDCVMITAGGCDWVFPAGGVLAVISVGGAAAGSGDGCSTGFGGGGGGKGADGAGFGLGGSSRGVLDLDNDLCRALERCLVVFCWGLRAFDRDGRLGGSCEGGFGFCP